MSDGGIRVLYCGCSAFVKNHTFTFDAQDLREWGKVENCMFCGKPYPTQKEYDAMLTARQQNQTP